MRAWGDWPALSLAKSTGEKRLGQVSWLSAVLRVLRFEDSSRCGAVSTSPRPLPGCLPYAAKRRQWDSNSDGRLQWRDRGRISRPSLLCPDSPEASGRDATRADQLSRASVSRGPECVNAGSFASLAREVTQRWAQTVGARHVVPQSATRLIPRAIPNPFASRFLEYTRWVRRSIRRNCACRPRRGPSAGCPRTSGRSAAPE